MTKFIFTLPAPVVVEANSQEDALSQVLARMSSVKRYLGDGRPLADTAPFFGLAEGDDDAEVTDLTDPIRVAAVAKALADLDAAAEETKS